MANPETGEKKLLKIIENPSSNPSQEKGIPSSPPSQGQVSEVATQVAAAVKSSGVSFSVPAFLAPFLGVFKGKTPSGAPLGLRDINKFLVLLATMFFVILTFNILRDTRLARRSLNFSIDVGHITNHMAPTLISPKPISEYLNALSKRNIFQPYEKKEVEQVSASSETERIVSRTQNLKLVGISWLDSAESASVMIEDTKSGTTYFLKQGEKINEITVKTIYADRVILSYEGEELTMKL